MLQAPSHLSRVCGHSHIKKFWLTQMQNESQTCENKSGLLPSYSRPVSGSSVKGPDCKQSPQRSSGSPSVKSLLTGAAPAGRPVRPVLAGAVTVNGGHRAASTAVRHGSLATCAESLSPPLRPDQTYRSLRPSSPDLSDGNAKEENDALDVAEEVDCSSSKAPVVEDLSASSSRCGSPSAVLGSRYLEQDLAGIACGEAEPTKTSNVESPTGSRPTTNGGDVFSSWEDCRGVGEGDVNASQEEQAEYFKCVDNDSSENHSVEPENSDSGTDAGSSEYVSSPVRVAWTGALDNRVRSQDGKAVCNEWTLAVPLLKGGSEKGSRIAEVCIEVLSANHCELSPENENSTHNSVLRICSLCGTTKTPLWRSGPHGPKSLCNACGIRFKKSRRCSGQSEGSELLGSPSAKPGTTGPLYRPLKRKQDTLSPCEARRLHESGADTVVPEASFQHPKRSRWPKLTLRNEAAGHIGEITGSSGESCLTWNLLSPSSGSPSSTKFDLHARKRVDLERLHAVEHGTVSRAISKDEEEAALLLMYLSCGFVYA